MNIQYSKKKQEIKRDPLVEFLVSAKEKATSHSTFLLGGVAAIALAAVLIMSYNYMAKSNQRKAQEAFGNAMLAFNSGNDQKAIESLALVTENHGNTPQAAYAAYLIGHLLRQQDRCDEAITWFEMARSKSKGKNFIAGGALEAMATCYESMDSLQQAVTYFKRALKEKHYEYRAPAIRWKLALLNKGLHEYDLAKEFCRKIVSDTLAADLQQDAENLLVELNSMQSS
ncbi:MAG: tetratricopeptide repeat protein [Chitinivibrionales bacterium]|nr:tetratricopeptide repeat protein [Chitinivibrionales bacterium]